MIEILEFGCLRFWSLAVWDLGLWMFGSWTIGCLGLHKNVEDNGFTFAQFQGLSNCGDCGNGCI